MSAPDITKRLRDNAAAMWEANHVAAWRVMLDAADIIEALRDDAAGMADVLRDIAFCIPSSAHSYNYDSDCDWLLRSCAEKLIAMGT